ncbi:sensor histidine kinase [Alphaproteobacteria bacterium KMM 3653]|uniref:C4-dicarboxylate transport sensor protein DctB n=2 Tax=Harenicola maris TaxID=2841044 RepID=A0AAP2CQB7_9RHOB|nr:sensor histidine kinase [Harenicola maris]
MRLVLAGIVLLALVTIYLSNQYLTARFTESTRNRAELRQTLYSGNIITELQRNSIVPLLLGRDQTFITALNTGDHTATSARLIEYRDDIGAASFLLLDKDGRAVGATERNLIGTLHPNAAYTVEALRANDTVFTVERQENGVILFAYSRKITFDNRTIGIIVVMVDLHKFERGWQGISDAVLITDSEGQVILATEPRWRNRTVDEALQTESVPSAIQRALRATSDWSFPPPDAYIEGQAVMRSDARIPFQGWRITTFTAFSSVRDQVNGALALVIMGFAMLLAGTFWILTRRAQVQSTAALAESAELRQLNRRLRQEIAEREKAEKSLQVAEQSLEQSSKLAALGEMSASVSHELNQPLAAMKTYLAGAKLLLQRARPDEALSSFKRIDDLINRMGSITRQLKSYARKGDEAFETYDIRESVSAALSMMEPQLKQREVTITRSLPTDPVMVRADRLRLEQVFVNLFRNAIEATAHVDDPRLDLILSDGETATLMVRDNGHGIDHLDSLFEPFYTTKAPGDGIGLGLAISSGIVNDLGGRLTARNGTTGGAVFEVRLPIDGAEAVAAE